MKKVNALLATVVLALSMLLMPSCGNDSGSNVSIPGVKGPTLTLSGDRLLISLVFENMNLDGGVRYIIPNYPKSYIEISPDFESSGTLMSVSVALEDVLNGNLQTLDPQKLPGGRNLPGVATGSLAATAFSIEKFKNIAFYMGSKVFGIFIPVDLGIEQTIATFRYYVSSSKVGNISIIGNDENGENGGILLLLDMSAATQAKMKSLVKKYK